MESSPEASENRQGQACGRFLHGGPERPLNEAVEIKSGLCWKPQIGASRAVGYTVPVKSVYRKWTQPRPEQSVTGNRPGSADPAKSFSTEHGTTEFDVCTAWFALVLVPYVLTTFWDDNVYILYHYMLQVCNLLLDSQMAMIRLH